MCVCVCKMDRKSMAESHNRPDRSREQPLQEDTSVCQYISGKVQEFN